MSSVPCLLDLSPLWTPVRRPPWVPSWSQYTTLRRKGLASSSGPCLSPASLPSTHTPGSGLPRKCTSPLEASSHFLQRPPPQKQHGSIQRQEKCSSLGIPGPIFSLSSGSKAFYVHCSQGRAWLYTKRFWAVDS